MIDIREAYDRLFANITPGLAVDVALPDALYRTLAEPIRCDVDHPPFDRAVMDGYAVRAADVSDTPVTLRLVGQVAAGSLASQPLGAGEAIQINTGAPLPVGADAVVPVEVTDADSSGQAVVIRESAALGAWITPRATYRKANQEVLSAGTRLIPTAMAVAAAVGAGRVRVYRRPTVAVLTTGDELVDMNRKPTGAQIRDSNRYLLEALITAAHAEPVSLGRACDDRARLTERVVEGLKSDVLCVTGGVSMGAFDFVPEVLKSCGATFHIHKMATRPGRPTIFATTADGTLIFALPGNPGSALVAFELLVKPALAALEGRPHAIPKVIPAKLRGCIKATGRRRAYMPARFHAGLAGELEVEPLRWHGSGDSFGMAVADALIMRPGEMAEAAEGEMVATIPLDRA